MRGLLSERVDSQWTRNFSFSHMLCMWQVADGGKRSRYHGLLSKQVGQLEISSFDVSVKVLRMYVQYIELT